MILFSFKIYAAFWGDKWWRVEVKECMYDGYIKVHFIDNGETNFVHRSSIGLLHDNMTRITPLATPYYLDNLINSPKVTNREVIEYLYKYLYNNKATLEVTAHESQRSSMKLHYIHVFVDNHFLNYELYKLGLMSLKKISRKDELIAVS